MTTTMADDFGLVSSKESRHLPQDVTELRILATQMASALNASEVNAQRERELRQSIEDVTLQLEPFEKASLAF
ncbi:unnamed protein product [Protopolystoma xenopodis]|uniref:Uncharacterized protein n=1 Tax=Protopolystoma xenopodis TaxID=117903 RepID=A0A448XHB3_9PLAT|nr:unnamed protein product [Protopolystoma xenopodis]